MLSAQLRQVKGTGLPLQVPCRGHLAEEGKRLTEGPAAFSGQEEPRLRALKGGGDGGHRHLSLFLSSTQDQGTRQVGPGRASRGDT